jgi:hypothetical protein
LKDLNITKDDSLINSSYENYFKAFYNDLLLETHFLENEKQERVDLLTDLTSEYNVYIYF